jgi:hypothetical protein
MPGFGAAAAAAIPATVAALPTSHRPAHAAGWPRVRPTVPHPVPSGAPLQAPAGKRPSPKEVST